MLRRPQGWRPWTPRPRYLPYPPYLTSTPCCLWTPKGIETTFGLSIECRQRPRSTPKPRRPSSTQRARGPSYQSKGLQSTVKPIPRTTPGSATTTGWRGCSNTEPNPICQQDARSANKHHRVLTPNPNQFSGRHRLTHTSHQYLYS